MDEKACNTAGIFEKIQQRKLTQNDVSFMSNIRLQKRNGWNKRKLAFVGLKLTILGLCLEAYRSRVNRCVGAEMKRCGKLDFNKFSDAFKRKHERLEKIIFKWQRLEILYKSLS